MNITKTVFGLIMVTVMTFSNPTICVDADTDEVLKTATHFAQQSMTVQCFYGKAVKTTVQLHVDCSEEGHYALSKGRYKSSNTEVATIDKHGNVLCTGEAGVTSISVKYKGRTYKTKIIVITPADYSKSTECTAEANYSCYGSEGASTWVSSRCLGKK